VTPTRCATICEPCARSAWAVAQSLRGRPVPTSRRVPRFPASVLRLAVESALIVAVAVVAGVAKFSSVVIVALMAVAFLIVALSEWLAARARFVPPAVAFLAPDAGEPAPYVEAPVPGWNPPPLEPGEDTEPDALTMIAGADDAVEDPAEDPWEDGVAASDDEEPALAERGGIFRRRRR